MATLNGLDLLFGDDNGALMDVQEGGAGTRQQPGPRVQNVPLTPGERRQQAPARPAPRPQPQQPPAAAPAPQTQPSLDGEELLFGERRPQPAAQAEPLAVASRLAKQRSRTGDARGALQRYVEGYQDPAHANLKAFDWDDTNVGAATSFGAKMMAHNDEAYLDIIKRQLGRDYIATERDKYGQPIVRYRDASGVEQRRYVNKPGLDMEDVQRGAIGAVPYVVGGAVVGGLQKGSGLLWNMLGQGSTAGATSASTQGAARLMGSNQNPDLMQTGIATAAGAGGALLARPAGAIQNRMIVKPGIVDDAGNLTPRGAELARRSGLDPDILDAAAAREFANTYALSRDTTRAATAATNAEFGIPVTAGQVTKDPQKLLNEKNYRMGVHGDAAKTTMTEFYEEQAKAIEQAARGKVAQAIAPSRNVLGQSAEDTTQMLGQSLRDSLNQSRVAARAVEKKAWDAVPKTAPTADALADLPAAIQQRLGKFVVDGERHPVAVKMAEAIEGFIKGEFPENAVPSVLGSARPKSIDDFRKILSNMRAGVTDPGDKAATTAIYKAFDDWQFSPQTAAKLGIPLEDLAKQKVAREVTSNIRDLYRPTLDGKMTPGAKKLDAVMRSADSPETILNSLLGAPGQRSAPPAGTTEALEKLKEIFSRSGQGGQEAWQDVGLAYWMRLVQTTRGTKPDYGVMLNNIDNALASHGSVIRTLYTPEQQQMIRRFRHALSNVVAKDPNPSGSGTAIAMSVKQLSDTVIRALGWSGNGVVGMVAAGGLSGVKNVAGGVGARRAIKGGADRVDPNIAPYVTGATSAGMRTDIGELW
jgi:hypothetical protein